MHFRKFTVAARLGSVPPLVLVAIPLVSCVSDRLTGTIVLQKLPEGGELTALGEETVGVPFQLTRSNFYLEEAKSSEGAGKFKYTVKSEQVPDPSCRYAVRYAPAAFSTIDFRAVMTPDGGLNQIDAGGEDELGPAIVAVGATVASIVIPGVAGLASVAKNAPSQVGGTAAANSLGDGRIWRAVIDALSGYGGAVVDEFGVQRQPSAGEAAAKTLLVDRMDVYGSVKDFVDHGHLHADEAVWMRSMALVLADHRASAALAWAQDVSSFTSDAANARFVTIPGYLESVVVAAGLSFDTRWERIGNTALLLGGIFPSRAAAMAELGRSARIFLGAHAASSIAATPLMTLDRTIKEREWARRHHDEIMRGIAGVREDLLRAQEAVPPIPAEIAQLQAKLGRLEALSLFVLGLESLGQRRDELRAEIAAVRGGRGLRLAEPESGAQELMRLQLGLSELEKRIQSEVAAATAVSKAVNKPASPAPTAPKARGRLELPEPIYLDAPASSESERHSKLVAGLSDGRAPEFVLVLEPVQ